MKLSLNNKLFLWLALLVFIVLFIIAFLNTTALKIFYIHSKKEDLNHLYSEINKIYNKYDYSEDQDLINEELNKIDAMKNIDIVVQNGRKITVYSTSKDFSQNKFSLSKPELSQYLNSDSLKKLFTKNKNYFIDVINDSNLNSEFVFLFGKLDNNFNIFIRTPMESIKESVIITNRFLIIGGAIALLISAMLGYVISNTFTKPIIELNNISKRMSNLDFSKKYEVTTEDEIGMLGNSINTLSTSLEETIYELKKANLELEKDIEETSKIAEMRSQFISDVSHELKTPIALIQGYAEGLADGIINDEESKKYYCEVILDEANKMAELTRGLLDLSNLEYGKNELDIQPFNITELINNLIKKQELILKEKNITVNFNYKKDLTVKGDIFRIEQVLTNYFNNAIKNVNEKNLIEFSIDDSLENNLVRVAVFNSGNNISDEDLLRIWNRLYKADTSRNRENGGCGIGLSLVKAIMKQHNMNYGCQNVDGGVNFYFELEKS